MGPLKKDSEWYKNAVIYALDVKTFMDGDGDGMGDFKGLISRLDHFEFLGITCLWLLPFYTSPLRDNGYDVSDYMNVDPRLGSMKDFEEFIKETKRRNIRVVVDLVINHSSVEHPWFKEARQSRDSKYRDFYVWHDDPDHDAVKVEFDHVEDSVWEYTEETGMYYLHRFYKEQADLNLSNPDVRKEILKIMDHWVEKGVSGFRIDAAHMITDPIDIEHVDYGNMHTLFSEMRGHMDELLDEGVLLGEANVEAEELHEFFTGKEAGNARMHMLFNFIGNKYTMLAFARRSGNALEKGMNQFKPVRVGHWVNFVRHHDELNTDMLDEDEKEEVFQAFAPEPHMQALHGVRRRLPPMLDNDRRRIELMYNLIFSMPGTPLINYGEEIAMGDDLSLEGRFAVRTPMQWDDSDNGGFSTAKKKDLYIPVIDHGDHAYKKVNVEAQKKDDGSMLHFMRQIIACRKDHPVMGTGLWSVAITDNDHAVAVLHESEDDTMLVIHNMSEKTITVRVFLGYTPEKITDTGPFCSKMKDLDLDALELGPYGSHWLELRGKKEADTIN